MASERLQVILQLVAGQYKQEARQAASATGQIGRQAQATGTATGKLEGQMGALAATAKVAVAGAAAAAVTKFGKDSIQAFLGFDDAMNQSLAIMGDVSDELRGDMAAAAREVGKTTRISAEEAAEAYFFLASAGLDAQQSISAMPQVAAFAQAGMFDMATATDLATDAQSALGLTVDDAQQNLANLTRVTDVFVRANTLANTSVQQISEAMTNRAGAAARALGIDVEEAAAVLAAFADQGTKGAEAGTQFAIVLRDLQTKALENKEAFAAAGISVFDAQGEFRNFGDIIADLEGRLEGMSDEQKKAELATLGFTDRSIAALTTLLGTSDAIREYEAELRKAGGTTEDVANNQLESFQGQAELLKGRVEDLQIALGEGLVPVLLDVANAAAPLVDLLSLIAQGYTDTKNAAEGAAAEAVEAGGAFEGVLGRFSRFATRPALPVLLELIQDGFEEAFGEAPRLSAAAAAGLEEVERASGSSADEVDVMAGRLSAARDEMYEVRTAALKARPDIGELAGAARDAGGGFDDVITSMENFETMLMRLTDPVFAAIDDQQRLAEATERYNDVIADPEATVGEQEQAMWDLVEAQAAAEASAAELPDDLQVAADHIAILGDRAGITDEHLQILRDTIMSFDGLSAQSTIGINVVGGEQISGLDINRNIVLRQHGGPVRADQPSIVGEDGPELWWPDQSGQIIPSNQFIPQQNSTSQSGFDRTVEEHHHYHLEGTGDAHVDAQRVGSLASVVRRMETF